MGFFQRIRNGFGRFMYGRNGADHLSLATLWGAILLDVLQMLLDLPDVVEALLSLVSLALLVLTFFRLFSRNLEKRRAENARFLAKVVWPIKRRLGKNKQQRADKEHKYFTCPNCAAVCRVPVGKGKIVITCPKCKAQIRAKT